MSVKYFEKQNRDIMATEVRAPARADRIDLFLAGGIPDVDDWQASVIERLVDIPVAIANPRREEPFERSFQDEQNRWEKEYLAVTDAVLFWFPPQTLCPMTLFELGVFTMKKETPIFVGAHPDYQRRYDILIQLSLARPEVVVRESLEATVADFRTHWFSRQIDY